MSSPVDRPFSKHGISPYAPKWARDSNDASRLRQRTAHNLKLMGADERVTTVPADNSNPPTEVIGRAAPESWLQNNPQPSAPRYRVTSGPVLLTVFLAALVAFVIVMELPTFLSVVTKHRSSSDTFAERFQDGSFRNPAPPPKTVEQIPDPHLNQKSEPEKTVDKLNTPAQSLASAPANGLLPWPMEPAAAPAAEKSEAAKPDNPTTILAKPKVVSTIVVAPPIVDEKGNLDSPFHPTRPLSQDEIETLLKQGNDFVSVGDFASARILFERIAEAGDARGAFAYAATYDPIVLSNIGAKGATPDIAKAREWYAKAQDLGATEARARLDALTAQMK